MIDEDSIRARYLAVRDHLDERGRRLFVAAEARAYGFGGILIASRATGVARSTIGRGLEDLERLDLPGVVRRKGSGRPALHQTNPSLLDDLRRIVEPATMGDPERPLKWVSKSALKLANALRALGHSIGPTTVSLLLTVIGYRRQVNRKTKEGGNHPDRDAQFEYINEQAERHLTAGEPVISVDTKKKELIGDFKNVGSDYRPQGDPELVRVHDFIDKQLGKAVPYGVYDLGANTGYVSVGIDHDTATFAVNSIRSWWLTLGHNRYPDAKCLMITADGGGSNGSRVRLWKVELQTLADELGIEILVCHYPPGCSKWNKIEHRLFCHITQNWRGKPLTSRIAIIELIAATTTTTGLTVQSQLDERSYPSGTKVTDAELARVSLHGCDFHPEWNYVIRPILR
jgi:hypothetical protein